MYLLRKIERASRGAIVSKRKPKEWQDIFFLLEDYIVSKDDEKKVIFLDEFPWVDTHKSGFAFENICHIHMSVNSFTIHLQIL